MKKLLTNHKDYNGIKNVKFIMNVDDFRLKDSNIEVIATVDVKKKAFTFEGETYKVFSDYSVKVM